MREPVPGAVEQDAVAHAEHDVDRAGAGAEVVVGHTDKAGTQKHRRPCEGLEAEFVGFTWTLKNLPF